MTSGGPETRGLMGRLLPSYNAKDVTKTWQTADRSHLGSLTSRPNLLPPPGCSYAGRAHQTAGGGGFRIGQHDTDRSSRVHTSERGFRLQQQGREDCNRVQNTGILLRREPIAMRHYTLRPPPVYGII